MLIHESRYKFFADYAVFLSLKGSSPNFASYINPLSANLTKWSNRLKQYVCNLPTNCLSVFDHFLGLALKGLSEYKRIN